MRQAIQHKNTLLKLFLAAILLLLSLFVLHGFNSSVSAAPIPAGCPGTEIQGPPSVDCSKIPVGCPGSTQQANSPSRADFVPSNCPYEAANSGQAATPSGSTGTASGSCRDNTDTFCTGDEEGKFSCGEPRQAVKTSFNIGCKGVGNPITDAAFAIIRFLTLGVGLVIVASLTFAGIQYTASRGDPKATAEAIGRIRSNVIAFLLFVFAYAILGYLIPAGFLN